MIRYTVSLEVAPEVARDWEAWMREHHVPEVLATGCFTSARFGRPLAQVEGAERWVITYELATEADWRRYAAEHAPALQADHARRFGAHVRAARDLIVLEAPVSA